MIRLAETSDASAVAALVDAAYSPYLARNGKVPGPMRDDYPQLIAQRHVYVLDGGKGSLVGLVVLIPEADTMLLDNVAVAPAMQGMGHGVRLIAFAEQCARAAGHIAIRLYTQEIMTENIALYRRLGFVETHRAHESGLDRVFMRKVLAAQ